MKHLEVVLHEIHIIETGEILKLSKNGDVLVSFANESCVINGRRVICGRCKWLDEREERTWCIYRDRILWRSREERSLPKSKRNKFNYLFRICYRTKRLNLLVKQQFLNR